jgi:2-dehydro-3-deoxyphosphogluconate aldolase / (4S)-4-hydroxy-2-oxoglutarate aldolase
MELSTILSTRGSAAKVHPMRKLEVLSRIVDSGLVAVIRTESAEQAVSIAEACAEGGAGALEITFTVPGADRVIAELAKRCSPQILIGAGTVLDPETARIAILSGAGFVVSPALNPETARLANRYQVPYLPGAGTMREIVEAMECGSEIIKVFPGETLGPAFVKAVKGPLPQASLMPTGGVSLENAHSWIRAGCVALGVGANLTAGATIGDYRSITAIARRFIEIIQQARA